MSPSRFSFLHRLDPRKSLSAALGWLVFGLALALAVVVAVALKVVGALFIAAMLIIPAAAAQRHARTPEQMAIGASLIGLLAVGGGLALSWFKDTPAGPSIVVCAAAAFVVSLLVPKR